MKRLALLLLLAGCGQGKFDVGVNAGAGGADVARLGAQVVRMSRVSKDRRIDVQVAAQRATARNEATPAQLGASLDTIIGKKHTSIVISRFMDKELLAVANKMKSLNMPFLSTTPVPPGVVGGNGPGFSLVPGYAKQAQFLAKQASASDKVAIVHIDDFYGNTLKDELTKALGARGLKVVDVKKYAQDWDEPRMVALGTILQKEVDPTLVYFLGRAPSLELVWQPFREAGGSSKVIGSDLVESPALYENQEAKFTGLRYVRFFDTKSQETRMKDLHDRYAMWIGRGEMTGEAVFVYDAMLMIGEALKSGAKTNTELIAYLSSLGKSRPAYKGISGELQFGADGEAQRQFQLAEVHDKEIVVVDTKDY